jgi:hypothetical protein
MHVKSYELKKVKSLGIDLLPLLLISLSYPIQILQKYIHSEPDNQKIRLN